MRATSSSNDNNPRRKVLTPEQVEAKKEKAVRFLRDVVADALVRGTDLTGEELAEDIEAESLGKYAERKGLIMENPTRTGREIVEHVLTICLPAEANREERRQAISAAQQALQELPPDASDVDELEAATRTVQPIADQVKRRCLVARFCKLWPLYLPAEHSEDLDEWARLVADVVRDMPADASSFQVDQHVRDATSRLVHKIEARRRWHSLIGHGKNYLSTYLNELRRDGVIDRREWLDRSLKAELERGVTAQLQEELTGEEERGDVETIVRSVVDEELQIEDESDYEDGDEENG